MATDSSSARDAEGSQPGTDLTRTASFQPQPLLFPRREFQPVTPLPATATEMRVGLFGPAGLSESLLSQRRQSLVARPGVDIVFGVEAKTRVTTDAGSLLRKSPFSLGVGVQRRTPIVNDPRVRGSRVGQLAAAGSYWIPARIDLDTMLSKIDSRIVSDMIVIKGPYSVRYGPGLEFIDVELLKSPRYQDGFQWYGSTSLDYKTNGQQWYGRQSLWGGSDDWGFRVGYGHRTGSDYTTGAGLEMPSGYKSRDVDFALGYDLSPDSHLEFNCLRLDQTDVEFPGYAFDIDYLVTDGYELEYVLENQDYFDRFTFDVWYNRTRFAGNAQGAGKRRQFPFLDFISYEGFTDVDAASTGLRMATTWGDVQSTQLTAGVDLRYIRQELNEIASGVIVPLVFTDANSPIPRSASGNPGLFFETVLPASERLVVNGGVRVDWMQTGVIDDPAKLARLGLQPEALQSSLADILGTDEFGQYFPTWAAYLTGEYELNQDWSLLMGAGHGERPPSLTELYVAQSFLFLLQNGQNTATGDPRLDPEKSWQLDLGLACDYRGLRGGISGFHTWITDYITFENLNVATGPPSGQVEQVSLKYVNTDLATLCGAEAYVECDVGRWLTPFATLKYVEGRDLTRDGHFATRRATPFVPSERVGGLPRGSFSGVAGPAVEPLPGIPPLESRVGIRLHQPSPQLRWSVELSARVVDSQHRVAASLLETPTSGFTVWDLRSYWQATDALLCVAGVENFTDQDYREHFDFRSQNGNAVYQPGVNFYFGSELTY